MMIRSDNYKPNQKRRLRDRLDSLYVCFDTCLNHFSQKPGFNAMCLALCMEMGDLQNELQSLLESYRENLPIAADEPADVNWNKEQDRLSQFIGSYKEHRYYVKKKLADDSAKRSTSMSDILSLPFVPDDMAYHLVGGIMELMQIMDEIVDSLHPQDDADIYCAYCDRELREYSLHGWRRMLNNLMDAIAFSTSVHQSEYFEEQRKFNYERLQKMSPHCVNIEQSIIYREGLGRLLWIVGHKPDSQYCTEDVLSTVKSIEYFSGRLEKPLTFLDKENSPMEEANDKTRAANKRAFVEQNSINIAYFRTSKCEEFFEAGYDNEWVRKFWLAAIHDEKIGDLMCEKLCKRKMVKTIHQVAGALYAKGVYKQNENYGSYVDAIDFNKPRRDSRIDYFRKGVDDEPLIQEWIINYNPPKENPTQSENQVGSGEG